MTQGPNHDLPLLCLAKSFLCQLELQDATMDRGTLYLQDRCPSYATLDGGANTDKTQDAVMNGNHSYWQDCPPSTTLDDKANTVKTVTTRCPTLVPLKGKNFYGNVTLVDRKSNAEMYRVKTNGPIRTTIWKLSPSVFFSQLLAPSTTTYLVL
jgi:hypothetical protein